MLRAVGIAVIAGTLLLSARRARAQHAPNKSDLGSQIVFVGMLPLDKANGSPDISALRAAQGVRATVEAALSAQSHEPVLGHQALTQILGGIYLPKWFECKSDVTCLTLLLQPVHAAGYALAMTGDYYVDGGTYHVRLVSFLLTDGVVSKEIRFELSASDVTDQKKWVDALRPLSVTRNGRVRIASNVGDVTCTVDGEACAFDSDGQTFPASPGDHTIELSKAGYLPEKIVVKVETGTTQEVSIALKPNIGNLKVVEAGGPRRKPTLTAVRTDKVVEIDGKLDDAAWQKAWIETNFTQNFPNEAKPPSERTELRVLYDDDAVYVGVHCFDATPMAIVSRLTRRDRDIESDKITVDISSKNDKLTSYTFQVNAAGVQLDGTRFADTGSSTDWDGVWFSAVTHDDTGWTAELKIPLAALRYDGDVTAFGFQVRRYIQRRQEIDEWSYVPTDVQGEVSNYGSLEGLTGLNAKRLVQITPYDTRRITLRTKQGTLDGTELGGDPGADVKIGLTPALTLDAAINPDFGTVEVDQVVLNLSTTETLYPEKRPFFLESAELLDTSSQFSVGVPGLLFFYSRRVGRTPPETNISGNDVEPAQPPPSGQILGAAKVTGTLAHRLSLAVVEAVTARADAVVTRDSSSPPEKVLVDPTTNIAVVRLLQEFAVNDSIGAMVSAVNRAEPLNRAAPFQGDPSDPTRDPDGCPSPHVGMSAGPPVGGRCTNDAYAGDIDTAIRTKDGAWGGSGQVMTSVLEQGPVRLVPDGTQIHPGDVGWGVNTEIGKYGGENFIAQIHYTYLSPKLELNDAGYLQRGNDSMLKAYFTLRTTKPWSMFLNTKLRLIPWYETYADSGKVNNGSVGLLWNGTFRNFWTLTLVGAWLGPSFNNRETKDGALQGHPSATNFLFDVKTDPRKPVIAELNAGTVTTTRGLSTSSTLTLNLRPTSSIELDVISDLFWSYGDPRSVQPGVDNMDGTRTYYFQDLDSKFWDVLLRATLTLSPTLSLYTYAQGAFESGQYGKGTAATGSGNRPVLQADGFVNATPTSPTKTNFSSYELNINAFLRWEYRPGSAFWLVYIRDQFNDPYDMSSVGQLRFDRLNGPATDLFLVKLSYLWEPLRARR